MTKSKDVIGHGFGERRVGVEGVSIREPMATSVHHRVCPARRAMVVKVGNDLKLTLGFRSCRPRWSR